MMLFWCSLVAELGEEEGLHRACVIEAENGLAARDAARLLWDAAGFPEVTRMVLVPIPSAEQVAAWKAGKVAQLEALEEQYRALAALPQAALMDTAALHVCGLKLREATAIEGQVVTVDGQVIPTETFDLNEKLH